MKQIFEYIDYREYLKDYYQEQKENNPAFSHRQFLQKAGISSPSFLKQVIDGKRNLTEAATEKFLKALKLKKRESTFFTTLILFNQSSNSESKQKHYLKLRELSEAVDITIVGSDTFDYYQYWYTSALRELVCQYPGKTPADLGKMLYPNIGAREVKKSIQQLRNLGLIQAQGDQWIQAHQNISTGHEVSSMVVRDFNRKMLQLAEQSLDLHDTDKRNISGITMGVSSETYDVLVQEINAFQDRVMNILSQDKNPDKVYQMNTMLFPLSLGEKK